MFPHEPDHVIGLAMGDAVVDDDDDVLSNSDTDDQSVTPDIDSVLDVTRDDAVSIISEANSFKSTKSKKRVQFLPDGILVRIREIPPRSNKSSSESDGSASESSSDSDDSDSDSMSDSDDTSDRETPPPEKTESENKFTTMPPLMWNPATAKGPYNVVKQGTKSGALVAKITGIHRTTPPPPSPTKPPPKKGRRVLSPKLDKRPKRVVKQNEKTGGKVSPDSIKRTRTPQKHMQSKKEGKKSPPPHAKLSRAQPLVSKSTATPKLTLAQRRINSAPPSKLKTKRNISATVSTSVTALPTSPQAQRDSSVDRVDRAMQSLSVGQLYTLDGFIFPSHQVSDLHLPNVVTNCNKTNDPGVPSLGRRESADNLSSPRRNIKDNITVFPSPASSENTYYNQNQQYQNMSPQSASRRRRHYAWQMANGSIQNTLQNTPSIAQLWDNVPNGISSSWSPSTTHNT